MFFAVNFLRATAQTETHGSISLADWSQDEIVIAADSRQVKGNTYTDTGCKVATLGNKLIFTATGRSQLGVDPTWNAYTLAPKLLPRTSRKGASKQLAVKMADAWGTQVKDEFQRFGSIALFGLNPSYVTTGLFADFETDGSLVIAVAKITYEIKAGQLKVSSQTTVVSGDSANSYLLGHNEILSEMAAGITPRALAWHRALKSRVEASKDQVAEEAIGAVELTILNLEKTKTDIKGVPFSEVGLPVAAVRLIRGKSAEWVAKGKCK